MWKYVDAQHFEDLIEGDKGPCVPSYKSWGKIRLNAAYFNVKQAAVSIYMG